jgi:chromosome segregation ATPase
MSTKTMNSLKKSSYLNKDNTKLLDQINRFKTGVSFDLSENRPNKPNKAEKRNSTTSHKSNQDSHDDEINILEEQVKEMKTRLHNQKMKLKKELAEKAEMINQQWESKVEEAVAKVTMDYNKLNKTLEAKDKQLSSLTDQISRENIAQKTQNEELNSLNENIINLKEENKKLIKVKSEAEAKMLSQTETDSTLQSKMQEWKDKHNALESKYWKKDEDIEQLRNEIRNMVKAHAQVVKDYKAQLKEAESILQEQDLELEDKEFQGESITEETDALISSLKDEIDQMK